MAEKRTCKRCGAELTPGGGLEGICPRCLMELGMGEDSRVVITGAGEPPPPPPDPAELAPLFPQHEILEVLGQGGMGVVYKARQLELDRVVALKILPSSAGLDPSFAERFQREARALAKLSHPNVVSIFDFGKAGEHFYFAMEYVDGVNLRHMIKSAEVSPRQALALVGQICDALQYAHDEGVVHRDIKPENILVDRKGRLKITDFGLAKILRLGRRDDLTLSNQVMGTPHYMAPEQVEHPLDVDHRADIYSLGVVFYELLTGELPLGRFTPPSGKVEVDVRLDEVVLKSLEKEPERRYQQASQMRSEVDHIDRTPGEAAPVGGASAAGGGTRHERRIGRGKWHVGLIVLAVLAVPLSCLGVFALPAAFLGTTSLGSDTTDLTVVEIGQDGPRFTEGFRVAAGLDTPAIEAANGVLQSSGPRYAAMVKEHTTVSVDEDGRTHVLVASFAEERDGLEESLWFQLEPLIGTEGLALAREKGLMGHLFDYGAEERELEIWREGDGFAHRESARDGWVQRPFVPALPPDLQTFWDMRGWAPQPLSAQQALTPILGLLERLSDGERSVELLGLSAWYEQARGRAEPHVHAKLDLVFRAPDTVAASESFAEFRRTAAERGWGSVAGDNKPLANGRGILVEDAELRIHFPSPEGPLLDDDAFDPGFYVRSTAQRPGLEIGALEIGASERAPFRGVRDRTTRIKPADKGSVPLARIERFLAALESEHDGSVVTEVRLTPSRRGGHEEPLEDAWSFTTTLTVRGRAE